MRLANKSCNSRQNFIAVDKNRLENQGFYGHFQLVDVAYEPEKSLSQEKWLYQDVTCLASVGGYTPRSVSFHYKTDPYGIVTQYEQVSIHSHGWGWGYTTITWLCIHRFNKFYNTENSHWGRAECLHQNWKSVSPPVSFSLICGYYFHLGGHS